MNLMPERALTKNPLDPQKLARALFTSAWVKGVTIVEVLAEHRPELSWCRITAKADHADAFAAMVGWEPALAIHVERWLGSIKSRRLGEVSAMPHAELKGEFRMSSELFAEFFARCASTASPSHIVTFFNGKALREYTPADVFDLFELAHDDWAQK